MCYNCIYVLMFKFLGNSPAGYSIWKSFLDRHVESLLRGWTAVKKDFLGGIAL